MAVHTYHRDVRITYYVPSYCTYYVHIHTYIHVTCSSTDIDVDTAASFLIPRKY